MSFIYALNHFDALEESEEPQKAFYETHIHNIIENMFQLGICLYGLFADSQEDYQNVLAFDACLSLLFFYKMVLLILDFSIERISAMIPITCLLMVSWLYLFQINKRHGIQPSNTRDDRILVQIK